MRLYVKELKITYGNAKAQTVHKMIFQQKLTHSVHDIIHNNYTYYFLKKIVRFVSLLSKWFRLNHIALKIIESRTNKRNILARSNITIKFN